MARFQFSLQRLLELRRLELRQIEACAAREAELAEAARRHRQALLDELNRVPHAPTGEQWLAFQHAAQPLRRLADEQLVLISHHEQQRQHWLQLRAAKQTQVDGLELLEEEERTAFRRRQRRREQANLQENLLRPGSPAEARSVTDVSAAAHDSSRSAN
ncbi:MAG: hypothetical protein KDB14_02480 [Planctomycetales bacterium]|nr:hypothetical protein [Planctomycetales bacterium]